MDILFLNRHIQIITITKPLIRITPSWMYISHGLMIFWPLSSVIDILTKVCNQKAKSIVLYIYHGYKLEIYFDSMVKHSLSWRAMKCLFLSLNWINLTYHFVKISITYIMHSIIYVCMYIFICCEQQNRSNLKFCQCKDPSVHRQWTKLSLTLASNIIAHESSLCEIHQAYNNSV